MDIDKNCSIACIDFYEKSEVGKYEQVSPILSLWFEGDAIITKDKALNFEEMKNAQDIYFRYNREILKFK